MPEQQRSHLQLVAVAKTTWATVLRTTGTVDWDNDHTTQAITQVSGPITRILVDTGARVKKGDVLLYVSSPDISNAISAYRKAKNRLDLAQHNLDRNKDLLEHKALSQRDFESAQADYNDASTDVQTSLEALRNLRRHGAGHHRRGAAERRASAPSWRCGRPSPGPSSRRWSFPARSSRPAPRRRSSSATSRRSGCRDTSTKRTCRLVHTGDAVEMRNSSFPVVFHGTVSYIGDMIDPATRTTPVRIVTRNSDSLLKKDLFLDVTIQDKSQRQALVVPTTSVLYDEQNFPFVYVQVEDGQVRAAPDQDRRATAGPDRDSRWRQRRRPRRLAGQRLPAVRQQLPGIGAGMIDRIVSFALSQRFMVLVAMIGLGIWGVVSFQNLPIDAYPDLAPPRVQIVTQWPGHAAEEVERQITIPLETEMNGIPKLDALRSISLYGLSSVTMNFDFDTDPYFARAQAFQRISDAEVPDGVTPSMSPLFSPSGLIYRYVLQSPDRSAQDLKILEEWVLERKYRAIQGVADDSGLGGPTMEYQVQLDPNKLASYGVSVSQIVTSSPQTTPTPAAASTRRAASSFTCAASAR